MKLFYLTVSACLSLFLFFMLQAVWGPSGANACNELAQYKQRLQTSIASLQDFSDQMNSDLSRLAGDESRLRQEAYRIGMVAGDETRIRLPLPAEELVKSTGTIASRPADDKGAQAVIAGVSVSFGLVLFLFLSFVQLEWDLIGGRGNRRHRPYHGARVQTASLE